MRQGGERQHRARDEHARSRAADCRTSRLSKRIDCRFGAIAAAFDASKSTVPSVTRKTLLRARLRAPPFATART